MMPAGIDGEPGANALAAACATAMLGRDRTAQSFGIRVVAAAPGTARLSMIVGDTAINGHGIAHGGAVFTLADTAFAVACNSRDVPHVALDASISFVAPARHGQQLEAVAVEQSLRGRTGVYDVRVVDAAGSLVAVFRGTCYRIRGSVLEGGNA